MAKEDVAVSVEASASALNALARDIERLEALRSIKDVQRNYAQLGQFGRWEAMASLFAEQGELYWGEASVAGRAAIAAWLEQRADGMDGIAPGSLHTEIIDQPLARLAVDGASATVRWMSMGFLGDGKGRARIEGGLYQNDYALEAGQWRISSMRYHPQYEGDYADGWTNVAGQDLPVIPFHVTSDETGVPIPPPVGDAPLTRHGIAELATRIYRLNDEDAVRNVQNAYGYYIDRRMWSDVVDLFADDCAAEIVGAGVYRGKDGVRRALERMGPELLTHGHLNERPIFDLVVDVLPGGAEAFARGIEIGMLADPSNPQGRWIFSTFSNRLVNEAGLWKLKELRITPLIEADYGTGWGGGGDSAHIGFAQTMGTEPLTGPAPAPAAAPPSDVVDLRRRLARSAAFDCVENVSSAYGFYLDDFQWADLAAIFAEKGNKQSPFAGYYIGRDRIAGAATASWGPAPTMRSAISFHWRTQPVIHVAHDARSANLRARLFQPRTSKDPSASRSGFYMGGIHGGMYPNDQAVLEHGIWRLWSLTIDEHYFSSPDWKTGWAGATIDEAAPPPPVSKLLTIYPPDVKMTELGRREEGFRGGTGTMVEWPGILPMWFHYRNPVSGRVPQYYWPDCVPSEVMPTSRMTAHGYQQPPTGPEIDGIELPVNKPR